MTRDLTLDVRGMEPPEPLQRVLETIGDFAPGDRLKLIIDCEPLPANATEVEIDFEAAAVQGGFETLTTAVETIAARDGSPPGVAADVVALLRSNDRPAALTEIRKRFSERRAACPAPNAS